MTTSTTNPTVFHTLKAHNAAALIDYLVTTLGFVQAARYETEDGKIAHAQLNWPEGAGAIMLGDVIPNTEWDREPGVSGAYLVTADLDGLYARVTAAGADITRPLADTDYGTREFAVRDPEGNLWSVGTYAGEAVGG